MGGSAPPQTDIDLAQACTSIPQLDGNISILSETLYNPSECPCCESQPETDPDCVQEEESGQPIPVVFDLPPTSVVHSDPPPP